MKRTRIFVCIFSALVLLSAVSVPSAAAEAVQASPTASPVLVDETEHVSLPEITEITFPTDLVITVIGDSVTAGVAPYMKKHFPNADIDAKACRQFSAAVGIIEQLLRDSKLSSTVVVQLGTNGTVKESDVRMVIELVGPDRKLVFVNCRVPRTWCEGDNKTFTKIAAEFTNISIADWYGVSFDKNSYFYKDGFHPNISGCTVMAQLIADTVAAIQPYKPYIPVSVSP